MKKFILSFLIICFLFPNLVYADWSGPDDGSGYWGPPFCETRVANFTGLCMATPEKFSFTLVNFRLRKESDKTFVNLASAPQSFDFASASVGTELGNFASGANVSAGTYDALSFVALGDAIIKGETTLNGGAGARCRTDSTNAGGVAQDNNPTEDYVADNNNTPLFDVILAGSDEVEGIEAGPGIEINYYNTSNQLVFIGDSINGISFPLTVEDGQTLTFTFSMRPVKGITFEWNNGNCLAAYTGDLRINIEAEIE